jgi:hypothetical protein
MTPKTRASRRPFAAAEARADLSSPTLVAVDSPPDPPAPDAEPASGQLPADPVEPPPVEGQPQPPMSAPPAQSFGDYKLLWETGRDALSITYACEREGVSSPLAIRIFNRRFTDEVQIRQIQRAATTTAELTHANIIVVYENGVDETGAPYVVSDWAEGDSLADVLAVDKRLDIARFLHIFQQACDGLIEAHGRQLMHRNLSPDKILLLQDDTVKLKDFGMPPDPVKNAFYLSVEQCVDANKIDARADIYSLGCIMYEALVGNPPFVGYGAKQASLDFLHDLANRYSPQSSEHKALKLLDCIIAKCLQRKPSKRFGSARELASALSMVHDCLVNGSNRRLPSKAEKLLLFRFLDMFDRKIVACMFAYLCLGLCCVKYLGEIQLQKDIDAAQLAEMTQDKDRALNRWKAALQQATSIGKPASLKAELHWQIAELYRVQLLADPDRASERATVRDALHHYGQAMDYFGKGVHHQAQAIRLGTEMAMLWYFVDVPNPSLEDTHKVIAQADKLYNQKHYAECAKLCADYLEKRSDDTIANLAACSYNELGLRASPAKSIRLLERAQYYMNRSGGIVQDDSIANNLAERYAMLGWWNTASDMHTEQARKAILEGDYAAALGELNYYSSGSHYVLRDAVDSYVNLASSIKGGLLSKESAKQALVLWERLLKLQQNAFGDNSSKLSETYNKIAECQGAIGNDQGQREALKNYFAVALKQDDPFMYRANSLSYVNLLEKSGKRGEAIEFLSKRLNSPFRYSGENPLHVKLVSLYAKQGRMDMANVMLDQLITDE